MEVRGVSVFLHPNAGLRQEHVTEAPTIILTIVGPILPPGALYGQTGGKEMLAFGEGSRAFGEQVISGQHGGPICMCCDSCMRVQIQWDVSVHEESMRVSNCSWAELFKEACRNVKSQLWSSSSLQHEFDYLHIII